MNKVLIIGGNGFLGGAIVNKLLKNKDFELFVTYRTKKTSRFFEENLDKLSNSFMLDVNNLEKFQTLVADVRPSIIIDLTSLVDVNKSVDFPKDSFESSALTTLNILESVRQ
jgi:nucleoside-diphosphate-sugar epimerase